MMFTRKQRAVVKLVKEGYTPAEIARETGKHPVSVYQLLSRAKQRIRRAGFKPEQVLAADRSAIDLLEMVA